MKFSNLKIGNRLLIGFGLLILLTVAFGVFALQEVNDLKNTIEKLYRHPFMVTNTVRDIKLNLQSTRMNMQQLIFSHDFKTIARIDSINKVLDTETLEKFDLLLERFLGKRSDVVLALDEYKNLIEYRRITFRLLYAGKYDLALPRLRDSGAGFTAVLLSHTDKILLFAQNKAASLHQQSIQATEDATRLMITILLFITMSGLLVTYFITSGIRRPLSLIMSEMAKFSAGNWDARIGIERKDEIGMLANAFNAMSQHLRQAKKDSDRKIDYLNKIPTPIQILDLDFNIQFINEAGLALVGKKQDEAIGAKCYSLLNTSHCRNASCRVDQSIRTDSICVGDTICTPLGQNEPL